MIEDSSGEVGLTDVNRKTLATVAGNRNNEKHLRNYDGRSHRQPNKTKMPYVEKIWVPKAMKNLMLSTTANSTSIHFGMGHMCHRHRKLFTLEHIEQCD